MMEDKIKGIINMCGVLHKNDLFEIYTNTYDNKLTKLDFEKKLEELEEERILYTKEDLCIKIEIGARKAKKYWEIQQKYKKNMHIMNDNEIFELYQYLNPISPISFDFIKIMKKQIDKFDMMRITDILKEQLEFNVEEILENLNLNLEEYTNESKKVILTYIIRIYHDTRMYKFGGFKAFEINAFLTNEEIDKIEKQYNIKFENRLFLKLNDIYEDNEYLKQETEIKNDDGSVTVKGYRYIEQFRIRKNKSFDAYLKEKSYHNLELMTKIYKIKNKIPQFSIFMNGLENIISKHKEEVLLCNYMVLEEEDYKFLKEIIKNQGYLEINSYEENEKSIYKLQEMGFIFTSSINQNIIKIHMPKDIINFVNNYMIDYKYKDVLKLRTLLKGIANAYGVIDDFCVGLIVSSVKNDYFSMYEEFKEVLLYYDESEISYIHTNVFGKEKIMLEAMNLKPNKIKEIGNIQGEYKKFTFDEYIALGNNTYMSKLSAYKKLKNYLNQYFGKFYTDELYEIEEIIYKYFLIQQIDKESAMKYLEKFIKEKYIIDYNKDIIYGELISLYSNVAKSMPQWYIKGEVYTEIKEKKEIKIGRNELCFCGSGKKYKKCHGR